MDLTTLNRIASRHGLPLPGQLPFPWVGATSRVYPLADVVLKVPFDHPGAIAALDVDVDVSAVMRQRGVQTPELLAFDQSRDVVPVPFAVYRRVPESVTLESLPDGEARHHAWHATGRQLAIVHAVVERQALPRAIREFRQAPEVDPRPWVEALQWAGRLDAPDAAWLLAMLDDLAPTVHRAEPSALCHGDVNATNVLVHETTGEFLAIIDWAGAGWLDPAWDFAGVPLAAVPHLLAGHRSVAPLPEDHTAEVRVFWCQVQTRLHAAIGAIAEDATADRLDRDLRHLRRFAATALRFAP